MRGKIFAGIFFAACFLFPAGAFGQTTQVSGTVVDPNGIPYGGGKISAQLSAPGATVTINNQQQCISAGAGNAPCKLPIQGTAGPASLDANGHFSMAIYSNTSINPAGTTWAFTVSISPAVLPPWGTGQQSFQVTLTITGATQDISANLNAMAPVLVVVPIANGAGVGTDCSKSPGADMGAKLNACIATASTADGIANALALDNTQTISTPVVDAVSVQIWTCNVQITQTATITLSGAGSSWVGCPNQITTITKGANLDQVEIAASNNSVQYVSLNGNRSGGFTGSGITVDGSATGALIENDTVFSEQGNDINDLGSFGPTFTNLQLSDYGTNGISLTSSFLPVGNNIQVSDAADSTGSALSTTATIAKFSNFNTGFLVGNAPAISVPTERLWMDHSFIVQTNGYPAFRSSGQLQVESSLIDGGGAHGSAVQTVGNLMLVGNPTIENASNTADIVQAGGGDINITGNFFGFQRSAGTSGVNINSGPTIGAIIANNKFQFDVGGTPTGDNWGIHFSVTSVGDYLQNVATGNVFFLNNKTTDHGIFFDNSGGNITANFNEISNNQCVDAGSAPCIVRLDATARHTIYKDNTTNQGTTELYDAGGSPNDLVTQLIAPFSFSNLPIAGDGSLAACGDCSITTPIAAGGTGGIIAHVNGVWTGNQAIVGGDTHTAEITGNYGPVSLLLLSAPTGSYLVTIYTEVSTSVATSTIATSIQYHDDTGAQTQTGASLSGATAGTVQSLSFTVRFVTGTALIYLTTTANSPKYKIFARVTAQ